MSSLPSIVTGGGKKKHHAKADAVPVRKKKRYMEGYGNEGGGIYAELLPESIIWHKKFADPVGSIDGDTIQFDISTANNEIVR